MLRVITGKAKGHKLKTPAGVTTRPTSDRVKESLFNIIAGYVADAEVLDLYAGTGNLGIEALSRGAGHGVFVDRDKHCCVIINDNLKHTGLNEQAEVVTAEAVDAVCRLSGDHRGFDLIFLDPPYGKGLVNITLEALANTGVPKDNCIIVAEHDRQDSVLESAGPIKLVRSEKYGDTMLSFYKVERKR